MSRVSYRDFNGEVLQDELEPRTRGPAVSIRRTVGGHWLLRLRTADAKPVYVRIGAALADAINAVVDRNLPAGSPEPVGPTAHPADRPTGHPGPTDPPAGAARTHTKGMTPDPPTLDRVSMRLLKRLERRGAFDDQSAAHQAQLVGNIGHVQGTRIQDALKDLKRRGLIETRRKLGTWLTESGRAAAAGIVTRK